MFSLLYLVFCDVFNVACFLVYLVYLISILVLLVSWAVFNSNYGKLACRLGGLSCPYTTFMPWISNLGQVYISELLHNGNYDKCANDVNIVLFINNRVRFMNVTILIVEQFCQS